MQADRIVDTPHKSIPYCSEIRAKTVNTYCSYVLRLRLGVFRQSGIGFRQQNMEWQNMLNIGGNGENSQDSPLVECGSAISALIRHDYGGAALIRF